MRFISPGLSGRKRRIAATFVLVAASATASEVVRFKNGFTLQADSHAQRGTVVEVTMGAGTLEFPAAEISGFDALPDPPSAAASVAKALKEVTPEILLSETALAQGMDAAFVRSVARVESGLKQASISNKGAIGLMQLMPGTAKELGVNAFRSDENARGGVQYLRSLLLRYQGDSVLALAAYNAGPGAVQRFNGLPPYLETRRYVVSVLKEYNRQLQQAASKQPASRKTASKPSATD